MNELTITTSMLHVEFVSTEALQHWEQLWVSPIRLSRTDKLKAPTRSLIFLSRNIECKSVKVGRVPEA